MWLLDTNVLSELPRTNPRRTVVDWVQGQSRDSLCTSVVVIGELRKGMAMLAPEEPRRHRIKLWIDDLINSYFAERHRPITLEIAERWGVIVGDAARRGITSSLADSLIAATAIVHDDVIVSRNIREFRSLGARVFNPWEL